MSKTYDWPFPLPRTHTGMVQGNGTFGAIIWGDKNILRITIGRADLWDHRGGVQWSDGQSYANIRDCLEQRDEARIQALFDHSGDVPGEPRKPSIVPIGRFEIVLPRRAVLEVGTLNLTTSEITVGYRWRRQTHTIRLITSMTDPILYVRCSAADGVQAIRNVPAWDYVGDYLRSINFTPPVTVDETDCRGWIQPLPNDPAVAALCCRRGRDLAITAVCGQTANAAGDAGRRLAMQTVGAGYRALLSVVKQWWHSYWRDVPSVRLPNDTLRFCYDYGMYKLASLTNPDGVPATLQGPWIEEYQMPPWSSDYHFNINVQMCYWPVFHGNLLANLRPLFDLIMSWQPVLRHNAKVFLGIDDGLMLPHAVDDRCVCIGGLWTGSIDHGCTAWVAQMMYRYYRYTLDKHFLRKTAYPFMVGAMRVYEEMLEAGDDGQLALPVSVSPEYRDARIDAWGRNASFQLACIHRLCSDVLDAAAILNESPCPIWHRIQTELPKATRIGVVEDDRIALWDGVDLEESHRHHSHLAGIAPFDTLSTDDVEWRETIYRSVRHWINMGPGLWSGWCVPWASIIHSRLGNARAAELWLEIWERVFTNSGRGTLHDVDFAGVSVMGAGAIDSHRGRGEIMQVEAGMCCVAAIQEMLLHVRGGVNSLFAGAPERWRDVGFTRMRTDGAFLVSARRRNGHVSYIRVESPKGGIFRLRNPWHGPVKVTDMKGRVRSEAGDVLALRTIRNDVITLRGSR